MKLTLGWFALICFFAGTFAPTASAGPFRTEFWREHKLTNAMEKRASFTVAVLIRSYLISEAKGIARFPTGGKSRFKDEHAVLYIVDLEGKTVRRAAVIPKPAKLLANAEPWIAGWAGGSVFINYNGQTDTDLGRASFTVVVGEKGEVKEISEAPEGLWRSWEGPVTRDEKWLRLSPSAEEITVVDSIEPKLIGMKIKFSKDGQLSISSNKK